MKLISPLGHVDVVIPTPLAVTRTIGPWTVGNVLGRGGHGKVFMGTSTKNEVVALKVMDVAAGDAAFVSEVQVNAVLTQLADKEDDGGRILRQKEVICCEDELVSVHVPVVPWTLADLVGGWSSGRCIPHTLMGVKFIHDRGWMHHDLKPTNVGVRGEPPRAVLLDVGTSGFLEDDDGSMEPEPGCGGTVTYFAPERELQPYNHSVDIWVMGIIGYEVTYGHHPFKFLLNPWRKGEEHEKLRPVFEKKYQEAIERLAADCKGARESPTAGYIHLGSFLAKMLRYPWAQANCEPRIAIDEKARHD
ncbi:kinase-like domain-containing protein [Staphylotrichum tortipilum]|uniref:Kinase-like domain-containing protein n=1 Tax=Staphylotrichum tortipilum TaxID=2831512 RepID=A0AAN6RUW6_9PEZI|nr:kinase-like domain-containing protein [Staphylotrichum longicolle]